MRQLGALIVVAACGGDVPASPAHLEELADNLPFSGQVVPTAFDANNALLVMDFSSGLMRFNGMRFVAVPNGATFTFGSFGVDRDGTLLLGAQSSSLARLEANDTVTFLQPGPPVSFTGSAGLPSGAYHVVVPGQQTTFVLPPGGVSWVDSMRRLDRTLRAPDGTIYAIENDDIVTLDATDAAVPVATCADIAGGTCPGLDFAGIDGAGHLHFGLVGRSTIHILDPAGGAFREVDLPGGLEIESIVAGLQYTLVLAVDPMRDNDRSLWMLASGDDQLLRFTSLVSSAFEVFQLAVDHAGDAFVLGQGRLHAVVLDG
jgi:hypothetical protein